VCESARDRANFRRLNRVRRAQKFIFLKNQRFKLFFENKRVSSAVIYLELVGENREGQLQTFCFRPKLVPVRSHFLGGFSLEPNSSIQAHHPRIH
jgi:hypothetical protein